MSDKINVFDGVKEKILAKQADGLEALLKPYREAIIAIHDAGLSWKETADHINAALNLKSKQRLNERSASQFARNWIQKKLVDQHLIERFISELKEDEEADEIKAEIPDRNETVDETQNTVKDNVVSTYKSIEEFTADVMKSPDQRFHNKDRIAQAFSSSKGKPKKEMITALRDIVLKSHGNV